MYEADLLKSRRRVENQAHDLAIYMLRVIRGERLTIIGRESNSDNYSSVSTAFEAIRRKLENKNLKKRYGQTIETT